MSKIFYDHLIMTEEITSVLNGKSVTAELREEVLTYADQTLHHHVLDIILTNLPKEHHQTFLTRFREKPHDETLLDFLKSKVTVDIEKEIRNEAEKVKKEIMALIAKT